ISSLRAIAASMAPACASTSAGRCSTTALIDGLTASSRASAADAASFAETFFDLIRAAISAADKRQRSCIARSVSTPVLLRPAAMVVDLQGVVSVLRGAFVGEVEDRFGKGKLQHDLAFIVGHFEDRIQQGAV